MSEYINNEVKIPKTNGIVTIKDLIWALQKVPQDLRVDISVMDGDSPHAIFWNSEDGKALWSVMIA